MKNITVLYEDEFCVVLDKGAPLAVQGGAGVRTSVDALLVAACDFKPFLVHRLDKETSGVLLVAKSERSAAYFSGIIGGGGALKQYLAVCAGTAGALKSAGEISEPLVFGAETKTALTGYRLLGEHPAPQGTWLFFELTLGTGRMHQIRRHLAGAGCPILGDDKYGDWALNKRLRRECSLKRLLLHAAHLALPLPDGRPLDIRAPLPGYFAPFIAPTNAHTGAAG